jgi:pyridinium-3,5-biscarboxylic acid mononucleotide synthase
MTTEEINMDEFQIRSLLVEVQRGSMGVDDAIGRLRSLPFEEVGDFANIDQHRALRCGFPEVVFGQGKTPEQVVQIVRKLAEQNERILVTRVSNEMYTAVRDQLAEAVYHPLPRLLMIDRSDPYEKMPGIVVATGGTADVPVAEEAALTAELMGNQVERIYDVGVAGLHRLLARLDKLQSARVVVAVAGMEGALPSVVSGLISAPVIAVPTSVGYGASFQGLAALLTMLNSCATGVSVVNIDNGFGAGYLAALINRLGQEDRC